VSFANNPVPEQENWPLLANSIIFIYRWAVVVPLLVVSTLFVCFMCISLSLIGLPGLANRVFARGWARFNAFVSLMKIEVVDRKHVDENQSYVIVANHRSLLDIYLLYGFTGIDVKWVMKKELRAIPIFGLACEKLGHVVVDRSNTESDLESMAKARRRIVNGTSIIFFPEGTRSRDESMLPFKKGAFRMAMDLGVPILPVSIHGTARILPADTTQLLPGKAKLKFHEPIPTADLKPEETALLIEKTRNTLIEAIKQE